MQQTKVFNMSFHRAIRRPCSLTIVSPFVTTIKPWKSILQFSHFFMARHSRPLTLITRPPSTGNGTLSDNEARALCNLGVNLKIRNQPPLHSKIYLFEYDIGDYAAFIGSANFTKGGFEINDETVVCLRFASKKADVLDEIRRFDGRGCFPFSIWQSRKKTIGLGPTP